jgi:hypothetical protein
MTKSKGQTIEKIQNPKLKCQINDKVQMTQWVLGPGPFENAVRGFSLVQRRNRATLKGRVSNDKVQSSKAK